MYDKATNSVYHFEYARKAMGNLPAIKKWEWIIMTEKESLRYLINGLINGSYAIKIFCSEFTRIYDLEVDYDELSSDENYEFGKLCEMTGRFSDDEEELKIPNMYCSENEIRNKVKYIVNKLK